MSEIIMDIIANITGFITYFAPGYIFLSCYNYAACLQREAEKEYLIMKSISISYLFYVLTNFVGNKLSLSILAIQAATFIEVVLLGLLLGRLRRLTWTNQLSQFLFKREMTNPFFVELWETANHSNSVIYVTLTLENNLGVYEGQICKVSSFNINPEILLAYYICYDCNMRVVSDYSNTEHARLLVRYSDIKRFEFEFVPIVNSTR